MRILLATDSFPPTAGGSGWSTWELARGLRARGHAVFIVQARPGRAAHGSREYDGFTVDEYTVQAPSIPFARNYAKNERLYPRLGAYLAEVAAREHVDVIHGQHVLTVPAAVVAGRRSGRPVVATVRDYWPVCYWGTLIHDETAATLCPACTVSGMGRCLRPRTGVAWPAAIAAIPYMRSNLARKRTALAAADAVIVVSRQIAADLRVRAPELAGTIIEHIPNPFDIKALGEEAARMPRPLEGRYALRDREARTQQGSRPPSCCRCRRPTGHAPRRRRRRAASCVD